MIDLWLYLKIKKLNINDFNQIFDPKVFDEMNVYDIEFIYPSGNPKINSNNEKQSKSW